MVAEKRHRQGIVEALRGRRCQVLGHLRDHARARVRAQCGIQLAHEPGRSDKHQVTVAIAATGLVQYSTE